MKKFEKLQEEIGAALGKVIVAVAVIGLVVLAVVPGRIRLEAHLAQGKVDVAALQAYTGGVAEQSDGLSLDTLTIAERFTVGEDRSVQLVLKAPTIVGGVCAYARWDEPGTSVRPRFVGSGCGDALPIGFEGAVELALNTADGG